MTRDRFSRGVVLACCAVVVVCTAVLVPVASSAGVLGDLVILVPLIVSFAVVGALVLWRQPRNAVGWLFLVTGAISAVGLLANAVGSSGIGQGSSVPVHVQWAAWVSVVYIELVGLPITLTFLLFPDGRLPSLRWRPVLVLATVNVVVGATIVAVSNMDFSDPTVDGTTENFPGIPHPLELVDPHVLSPAYVGYQVMEVVLLLAAALSLVVRYRASGSATRAQIRWVTFAATAATTGYALSVAFWSDHIVVAFAALFPLVPVACGVAILRYRLYDIDRLISRTLSYAVVTGVVLGVYGLVVAALTELLPSGSSSLVVAAATLVAAALVRPVLQRVQRVVDRRFDRGRYDALATVEAFGMGLRDQIDADSTTSELLAVVRRTMAPSGVALARVRSRDGTVVR